MEGKIWTNEQIIKLIEPKFNEYLLDFIYLDPYKIEFYEDFIQGPFLYRGAKYLTIQNRILNNTEAMLIFNQSTCLLLGSIFLRQNLASSSNLADSIYLKLDGVVFKYMDFSFKRSITANDELTLVCKAEQFMDERERLCFVIDLSLANDAFKVCATAVCLDKSIHREGL